MEKIPLYFRVRERLKRVTISLSISLNDLKDIFISKFPEIITLLKQAETNQQSSDIHSKISFCLLDKDSQVQFELENINDLYPNAILEYRHKIFEKPHTPAPNPPVSNKEIGISSFKLPWLLKRGLVIVTVGLPGRGKSYVSRKLESYLNWVGVNCRVFNLGDYRRKQASTLYPNTSDLSPTLFFDAQNEDGSTLLLSALALDDMVTWLSSGEGKVGIYDGTNLLRERRRAVLQRCRQERLQVMFLESIIEDPGLAEKNLKAKLQFSPDYMKMNDQAARDHFNIRMQYFLTNQEPITSEEIRGNYLPSLITSSIPSFAGSANSPVPTTSSKAEIATRSPMTTSISVENSLSSSLTSAGRSVSNVDLSRGETEEQPKFIDDMKHGRRQPRGASNLSGRVPPSGPIKTSTSIGTLSNQGNSANMFGIEEMSVVKLIDLGTRIEVMNVHSYVPCRIVFFLKQLHRHDRVIWLTRHGETFHASQSRIGGDSGLTEKGEIYAHRLADWIPEHAKNHTKVTVWTSTLKRSVENCPIYSLFQNKF